MELNNLSKEKLIKLKQDIDDRLKVIEVKETTSQKDTMLSLEEGDKIFGIRLSFGGHRLEEPTELNGRVDIIDYCNIEEMGINEEEDGFRISISHPQFQFGISTTLIKSEYEDEHCYLCIDTMKTGYDAFYTLKPENWKEDLIRMYNKNVENRKKYFQKDLKVLENKLQLIINSEETINNHI